MNSLSPYFEDYIETEEFGIIYIPKVSDLLKIDESENSVEEIYNLYAFPFQLILELFKIDEKFKEHIKIFDIFIFELDNNKKIEYEQGKTYFDLLMSSLEFFFHIKPIYRPELGSFQIGDKYINRYNFDKLSDIILKLTAKNKIVIEKPEEFKSDYQRNVYNTIMEGRKRQEEKNRINLMTVINIVAHGGNSYIPYREIKQMNIPQLFNSYQLITGKDYFDLEFKKYLAGAEPDKLDLTHWIKRFKDVTLKND